MQRASTHTSEMVLKGKAERSWAGNETSCHDDFNWVNVLRNKYTSLACLRPLSRPFWILLWSLKWRQQQKQRRKKTASKNTQKDTLKKHWIFLFYSKLLLILFHWMAKVFVLLRTPTATHTRTLTQTNQSNHISRDRDGVEKKNEKSPNDNHEKLFLAHIQRTSDRPDKKDLWSRTWSTHTLRPKLTIYIKRKNGIKQTTTTKSERSIS